jgi:DNA-directed RNA polymerase specialized sigma24 family protein
MRRELAEEILQNPFVFVWRNAHAFDPERGAAMAWLARIVRNRCIDLLRQRGREAALDEASIDDWEDRVEPGRSGGAQSRCPPAAGLPRRDLRGPAQDPMWCTMRA